MKKGSAERQRLAEASFAWLKNAYCIDTAAKPLLKRDVYNDYLAMCKERNIEPVTPAVLGKLVRSAFVQVKTARLVKGNGGISKYYYRHLRRSNSPETGPPSGGPALVSATSSPPDSSCGDGDDSNEGDRSSSDQASKTAPTPMGEDSTRTSADGRKPEASPAPLRCQHCLQLVGPSPSDGRANALPYLPSSCWSTEDRREPLPPIAVPADAPDLRSPSPLPPLSPSPPPPPSRPLHSLLPRLSQPLASAFSPLPPSFLASHPSFVQSTAHRLPDNHPTSATASTDQGFCITSPLMPPPPPPNGHSASPLPPFHNVFWRKHARLAEALLAECRHLSAHTLDKIRSLLQDFWAEIRALADPARPPELVAPLREYLASDHFRAESVARDEALYREMGGILMLNVLDVSHERLSDFMQRMARWFPVWLSEALATLLPAQTLAAKLAPAETFANFLQKRASFLTSAGALWCRQ